MQLLYQMPPDYIKFDPHLLREMGRDPGKRHFARHAVSAAHMLGTAVIAKGIESETMLFAAKELGCTMAEGNFVLPPTTHKKKLLLRYPHVEETQQKDRRQSESDRTLVLSEVSRIKPVVITTAMNDVFVRFRNEKQMSFLPVIDENGVPLGILVEKDLKDYIYSAYGRELLMNKQVGDLQVLTRCPVVDSRTGAETILELFTAGEGSKGILITEEEKYTGFLSARSLLRILNEKNMRYARDQNPLSRLPGNTIIDEQLNRVINDSRHSHTLVYFDFDNFKPYNDTYGFRQGDRAILLFADLLRTFSDEEGFFIGHVGGDDFFACWESRAIEKVQPVVEKIVAAFSQSVRDLYTAEDQARGFIQAKDREGNSREFPLLSVSAALLCLPKGESRPSSEEIGQNFARLKKEAKRSESRMAGYSMATG